MCVFIGSSILYSTCTHVLGAQGYVWDGSEMFDAFRARVGLYSFIPFGVRRDAIDALYSVVPYRVCRDAIDVLISI